MALAANGEKYFEFDTPLPRGNSTAKIIFTTPTAEGGQAKIPRFRPTLADTNGSTTYMTGEQFRDYGGIYNFRIGLIAQGSFNIFVTDTNIFYDGSEHHIYGEVELFGVKFKNVSDEPLIFKISDGNYVYIAGSGTATTKDGSMIQFGRPIPINTPRPTSTPTPVQPTRIPAPVPPTPTLVAPLSPLPSISDTDRERYGLLPLCERIFITLGNQVLLPDWADCYREIQIMQSESDRVLMLSSPSAHISFLPTGMPGLVFDGIAFRTYSLNGDTINEAEVSPWSTGRVGAYYNEDTPTAWNITVSFDKGGEWSGQVDLAKSPLDLKKTIDRQAQTSLVDQSQAQDTNT